MDNDKAMYDEWQMLQSHIADFVTRALQCDVDRGGYRSCFLSGVEDEQKRAPAAVPDGETRHCESTAGEGGHE